MTIEWRYSSERDHGVLSVAGYLGADAVGRFTGAVGWVLARGAGPVVLDLTELRGWSADGQSAITLAARRLADQGRSLELAAIPADGSLVPDGDGPPLTVHGDLAAALAARKPWGATSERPSGRKDRQDGQDRQDRQWRTDGWPS
ncbi:STAS domain-containing protein [Streptomyces apocyni]|uniref:STAS domain-containing protein n=1 Tax=Streptomyces apocyni TaxID=2654677 RepID=UPI0012EA2B0D|nr:STAS domain-containing protein [Streptomyces apocyni]